ncbi:hypothetical protein [Streptomyces sp. SD31]|uniref:hypothetical protein n=1 Tax=Streptomyces sp. SD31 TaxID=3452208 RepID=UPI003F8CDBE0
MAEVWVATNLADDGKRYRLIRADDLRHLQLVGEVRPRLMAQVPGGVSGWVPLVDSPEAVPRFSGVMGGAVMRPPVPEHFHLELARALDVARLRVREDGHSLIVRAVVEGSRWMWRAESYVELLGEGAALARAS